MEYQIGDKVVSLGDGGYFSEEYKLFPGGVYTVSATYRDPGDPNSELNIYLEEREGGMYYEDEIRLATPEDIERHNFPEKLEELLK